MPSSPEFDFPSDEGEEPMDPDVEPSDEGEEPMDPDAVIEELEIDPDAVIEELKRLLEEVKNSGESDSVQSAESAQEQLSELQVSKLQAEIRQQIEGMGDAVIEGEYAILLEGQPLFRVRVRDSVRDELYLVLKSKESGFDKLGDSYAHTIDPEQVENTFNWLSGRDKKVSNFYDQSAYLKNVAASREEKTA